MNKDQEDNVKGRCFVNQVYHYRSKIGTKELERHKPYKSFCLIGDTDCPYYKQVKVKDYCTRGVE